MNALLDQFLSESREALQGIGEKLMQLERAPADDALMTHLFRLVHTLKGNSGLFEFPEMTRVLHAAEDLMDAVRHGRVHYSQGLADRLLDAMDFVGMLCDDAERGEGADPGHGETAVRLAQALRALIDTPAAEAAIEEVPEQTGWVEPALAAALSHLPDTVRQDAARRLSEGQRLHFVCYTPHEECFYQGDDPLHRAIQTPGSLWGAIRSRGPWPAVTELDAFRCVLDFHVLSHASPAELDDHYRYVADQRQIHELTLRSLRGHSVEHDAALQALVETQREVLALPDDAEWLAGRIRAASGVLRGCLSASDRGSEIECLETATEAALNGRSAAPLAAWLATAFPAAPLAPAGTGTGAGTPAGQPAPAPDAPGEAPEAEERTGGRAPDAPGARTLKVDQDKVDRLMALIGEMVVAKNAIPYLAARAEAVFGARELSREIKAQYAVINRISEEMQDAIMQVRMMPVSFIFQRFPRLVRDTSRRLGKNVNLVLEGQDTAADKNIIEALGDPLVHIVRNSLDHGLELPQARVDAGKPAAGTLKISATQASDRVVIEIEDDGKGIDPVVVKRKACQLGLIDEQAAARLSDADAVNLIFAPGFSTADVVSDLSGRGVGMDVVRTAVERVNGSIHLESTVGKGTRIRLSLPLSMAVTNVMTIESNGQQFGVPMDSVVETVRVPRSAVRGIKQSLVTVLRDRVVPLRSLNELLGLNAPSLCNDEDELAVLVVRAGNENVGLLVDEFRGTADIILKPLVGLLAGLSAYSGSALMGDGSVLMVLDVKEML